MSIPSRAIGMRTRPVPQGREGLGQIEFGAGLLAITVDVVVELCECGAHVAACAIGCHFFPPFPFDFVAMAMIL